MIRRFVALALVGLLAMCSAALATEQIELNCLDMPGCCEFSCVKLDLDCCGCDCAGGPLWAEFLDREGNLLGTASFDGYWCNRESYAQLDTPVDSGSVCSVRLVKENDDVVVTWGSLRVLCDDNCSCGKWYKVWKGDLWCWEQVVEEIVEEPVAVTPPPAKPEPPKVAKKPEPRPDFSYFPPAQPEPEQEVMIVIGNG